MKQFYLVLLITLTLLVPACKSPSTSGEEPQTGALEPKIEDRLLTDAEMVTEEDPDAPAIDPAWENWIKDNAVPVRSLTHTDFSDLQFLKPLLPDRRIVQLGESGHGFKEFNKSKVRLIKFLHEEMGFDVIAFESCIFDCYYTNYHVDDIPLEMMKHSIYGIWHTSEVNRLFKYIKETQSTARPLILAGVDMKSSSSFNKQKRPAFLKSVIEVLDPDYAAEVFEYDNDLITLGVTDPGAIQDYYVRHENELKEFYGTLINFFDANMTQLTAAFPQEPGRALVARQAVWSFVRAIEFHSWYNTDLAAARFARDNGMAENLAFLYERLYPGKKIMLWAHNFHIRHNQEAINGFKTMGAWVAEKFRPVLYTIGLYMYRGQGTDNAAQVYNVAPAAPGSLEAIGYHARLKHFFLDMLNQTEEPGNSWMFGEIPNKSWGTSDMESVLKDQYDGILFIDTASPPDYM